MGDFESDDRGAVDRRTLLKVAGGTAVAGGAAATGVYYASQPAMAAEGLTAEDVSVESADGELENLTIAPTITVQWENYPEVHEVAVRFRADGPQSNGTVISWTDRQVSPSQGQGQEQGQSGQQSGEMEFDLETANMLSKNGGPLDASSFQPDEGEEKESEVTVSLDVRLIDEEGNNIDSQTPIIEVTYAVRVTNLTSEVTVTGQLNTGAECISVDPSLLERLGCTLN